ncbi:hypothetical protein PFLUV_G00151330 [Perca fluviatilis]|uniref:Uncharacterized protein n=1 Tax=Perca fluviatilis TaxID=8168 RepID=A0A6A5ES14_PERFL|nr:hypothetical protein PFLUV_G00151330 [Perca fluviatilis]
MKKRGIERDADFACILRDSGTDRDEHLGAIAEAPEIESLDQSLYDMSIVEEDVDENVFNDLMNSVIDWTDEGSAFQQRDDGEKDDISDEEYLPPISIRMGGALKTVQSVDHVDVIGLDETVHDLSAHEDPTDEPLPSFELPNSPDPLKVQCVDDIISI